MKPNIILITTDQQRKDSIGCYGFDHAHTPHLDALAGQSIVFDRSYCTSPVCTPSRASLYSGKYVSKHGAWNVGTSIAADEQLLSHYLAAAGYRTHHIGKAHFQPYLAEPALSKESILPGWEENLQQFTGPYYGFQSVELALGHTLYGGSGHYGLWLKEQAGTTEFASTMKSERPFGGEAYDWDIPKELHNSSWTANRAIAFLKEHMSQVEQMEQSEQTKETNEAAYEAHRVPFFLSIGFQDPHHPHAVPLEKSRNMEINRMTVPDYIEGELADKPAHFAAVHTGEWSEEHPLHGQFPMAGQSAEHYAYRLVSEADGKRGKAYYYAMVEQIDEAIGEMMEAIHDLGLEQQTIIIFTSDHGELLGDHGLWMKGPFHYESIVNIPLIWYSPAYFAPGRVNSIVSLVDIVPTLLDICNIAIPAEVDGISLKPLLLDEQVSSREAALIEHVDDPNGIRLKTIVTAEYKCTIYYGKYGRTTGELYDLEEDPSEKVNLWGNEQYAVIQNELLLLLLHELETIERRTERLVYA